MCPQTVVSRSDSETGCEVVGDGPDGGRQTERSPPSSDKTDHRDADNQGDVEPVDVLVPILLGHGHVGDVRPKRVLVRFSTRANWGCRSLLGVVVLVTVGFRGLCHGRWLRHLGRVDCHHAGSRLVGRHAG